MVLYIVNATGAPTRTLDMGYLGLAERRGAVQQVQLMLTLPYICAQIGRYFKHYGYYLD
jgi:hypothetical protein